MAESSEDIESGSHRLISPLRSEKEACLDKKLRVFAFGLALIEKAASTIGTMNFIWATVVLLGGFSTSLKSIDFWFVSVILVVEGLRILCRQGELATKRSWSLRSRLTLITLYSLLIQELSAFACLYLSELRVLKQQYGSHHNMNRNRALNLFYWLSIVESSLTLLGFTVRILLGRSRILLPNQETSIFDGKFLSILFRLPGNFIFFCAVGQKWSSALEDDGFDHSEFDTVLRYFYDTYCRCMNGSVFDGLKMDFLSYSVELLQSIDDDEQLEGARLLSMLLKSDRLRSEKLGTTPGVLERLIELLNWEKPQEQEIRIAAGEIICKLVEIPRNGIRVMAIPESMESINSLVYDRNHRGIHRTKYQGLSSDEYNYPYFSVLGKRILKILANDSDNRAKIRTNRGLLRKIIEIGNLDANASESEIISYLDSLPMETLALRITTVPTDVRENNNGTSGFEAEHPDDPNLQSV